MPGGAIAGVATLGGAMIGSGATKSAARTQANAANQAALIQQQMGNQALAAQQQAFDRTFAQLSPYAQMGTGALGQLGSALGVPISQQVAAPTFATSTSSAPFNQWEAYVRAPGNEDLLQAFQASGGKYGDITQFGQIHYQTHGQREGRTLPSAPVLTTGGATAQPVSALPIAPTPSEIPSTFSKASQTANAALQASLGVMPGNVQFGALPGNVQFGALPEGTNLGRDFGEFVLEDDPGFQFALERGLKAVQSSAAARGRGMSGSALMGAADYATGAAHQFYNERYDDWIAQQLAQRGLEQQDFSNLFGITQLGDTRSQQQFQNALGLTQVGDTRAQQQFQNAMLGWNAKNAITQQMLQNTTGTQGDYLNYLMQLAQLGSNAAAGVGGAAQTVGAGTSNIFSSLGTGLSSNALGLGNALGAGQLAQGNIWSNALGDLGALGYMYGPQLSNLFGGGKK